MPLSFGIPSLLWIIGITLFAILLSGSLHLTSFPPAPFQKISPKSLSHVSQQSVIPSYSFMTTSKGKVHYKLSEPSSEVKERRRRKVMLERKDNEKIDWEADRELKEIEDENQPTIVLVHGISMGMSTWNKVEDYLVNQLGRRVLTFDLFGRGLSDSSFPNNAELFTSQLAELLFALSDQLGPSKYDIIGKSMGGAIAAHFCATFPQKINKAIFWAPAGLPVPYPLTAELAKLPLLGDLIMPLVGPTTLADHIHEGFH